MSAARFALPEAQASLIERAVRGDTFEAISAGFGCSSRTVWRAWQRLATPEQQLERTAAARRPFRRGRQQRFYAELIRQARAGDSWQAIGARFFPWRSPERAISAVSGIFHRNAAPDDLRARRAALRRHNYNLPRGLGPAATARRRDEELAARRERVDPFAAMGLCFA